MLQLIEYSAADDAVVAVVAELLEAAAVDGERLEAVAAVGSTAGHVSVAVAVGIHKTLLVSIKLIILYCCIGPLSSKAATHFQC